MNLEQIPIVEEITRRVADGSLPAERCVNCDALSAERRSFYAICDRAKLRWEDKGGGVVWGAVIGHLPFMVPVPPDEVIEHREGADIVAPVPISVCKSCWRELDGGWLARALSFAAQLLFLAGIVLIVVWFVAKARGSGFSFPYAAACLAASLPVHGAVESLRSGRMGRVRAYLEKVPEYAQLFALFPDADVVSKEPTAMIAGETKSQSTG